MRLAVKLPCILARGRCAVFAFRGRAGSDRVQFGTSLREMNVAKNAKWEEFYVEEQFVSCRAGEPVYVGRRFRSGEDQGWCNGDLGGHLYRARRGRHARLSDRIEQIRQEDWRQGTGIRRCLYRCDARFRGARRSQTDRTGQGTNPAFAAVGRRRYRGQEFRQDAPGTDVHQRRVGRAGNHLRRSGAEFLPLQHGRRPVAGRPGQICL